MNTSDTLHQTEQNGYLILEKTLTHNMIASMDGIIHQSLEDIQEICVHVWRDKEETNEGVTQECIRCKKTRTLKF